LKKTIRDLDSKVKRARKVRPKTNPAKEPNQNATVDSNRKISLLKKEIILIFL